MLSRFLPKSIPFFEILASQADFLQKQTAALLSIVEDPPSKEKSMESLSLLKDEIYKSNATLVGHLAETFITPIDKEDIHTISVAQRNIGFNLYTLGIKFIASETDKNSLSFSKLLGDAQELLILTKKMIEALPQKTNIIPVLEEFNSKKTFGCNALITTFFEIQQTGDATNNDLKSFLSLSIRYEQLSNITEQIQGLADTLEQVMIKYV